MSLRPWCTIAVLVAALVAAGLGPLAPVAAPTSSTAAGRTGLSVDEPGAEGSMAGGVVEVTGRVYGSVVTRDGRRHRLRMDLWLPAGVPGARPTIVLVHGGAFVWGSRRHRPIRRMARTLAQHGYVTASVSYRLTPTATTRQAIGPDLANTTAAAKAQHDVQAAVRYLRMRADRYRVDPDRIAVLGASAGGITALRVAFNPEDPGRSGHPGHRSDVAAAVSLWGNGDPDMIEPGAPPVLMFHGRKDRVLPLWSARRVCVGTRRAGGAPCRRLWWDRAGHAPWGRIGQVQRVTLRFLDRHLN